MIHEWRSYRLKPGAATDYLTLLATQGLPLVTRHLPLMGYWLAETGALNVIHHLWAYESWAEREAARAALAQEEGWVKGFVPRAFALVDTQENRLLRLDHASPEYTAALAARRRSHAARPPNAPLFAADCAGLLLGSPQGAGQAANGQTAGLWAAEPQLVTRLAGIPQPGTARFATPQPDATQAAATSAGVVAQWRGLSGDPRPVALLPRAANPIPAPPAAGVQHVILRPLAFSPL